MGRFRLFLPALGALAAILIAAVPALADVPGGATDTPPPPRGAPAVAWQPLTPDSSVLEPSLVTAADLDRFLARTPLSGKGNVFLAAEAASGVNARVLAAITWVETNAGAAGLGRVQYNLFDFKGDGPYGYLAYSSYDESIATSAAYIGKEYAHPGGRYFRGGTIAAVGRIYAEDPDWPLKVAQTANQVGTSAGPEFAAGVTTTRSDPAHLQVRVVNLGYAAWDRLPGASLLVHVRWSRPGAASLTAIGSAPLPPLRSGAAAEIDLAAPSASPASGQWWLIVDVELTGDGWVADLGASAVARHKVDLGGPETERAGGRSN